MVDIFFICGNYVISNTGFPLARPPLPVTWGEVNWGTPCLLDFPCLRLCNFLSIPPDITVFSAYYHLGTSIFKWIRFLVESLHNSWSLWQQWDYFFWEVVASIYRQGHTWSPTVLEYVLKGKSKKLKKIYFDHLPFLWGSRDTARCSAWVNYENICIPFPYLA